MVRAVILHKRKEKYRLPGTFSAVKFSFFLCKIRYFERVAVHMATAVLHHPWEPASLDIGVGTIIVSDASTGAIVATVPASFSF
jgi:hypothetical protein